MKVVTSNCIICRSDKILLGMKKRGFGQGRWNGFGGKLKEGERLDESADREIKEECGLTVITKELIGVLNFEYSGKEEVEVNIFKVSDFEGEPIESEEMKPQWFKADDLPFDSMWPDDKYWIPWFLAGEKFKGTFIFKGYDKIISYEITKSESKTVGAE